MPRADHRQQPNGRRLDRVQANTLIGKLAPIVGGKGGGKPDLAQAGGKDADKLNEAIATAPAALREILG